MMTLVPLGLGVRDYGSRTSTCRRGPTQNTAMPSVFNVVPIRLMNSL